MARRTLAAVALLLIGLALRIWLAWHVYPVDGDPVTSYCFRALLLSHGVGKALFNSWQLWGYPVLITIVHSASLRLLSVYQSGILINLVSTLALVYAVDGLLRPIARRWETRLICMGCLLLWETLFLWQSIPVTEPLFVSLIYGAVGVLLSDRWSSRKASLLAGLLIGLACTVRKEGLATIPAFLLWYSWPRIRRTGTLPWGDLVRFLIPCGGLAGLTFFDPSYAETVTAYSISLSVPPVVGITANLRRAVECFYFACTQWLPQVLLIPHWLIVGAGVLVGFDSQKGRRLNLLLLLICLFLFIAVMLTVMVKRTGIFMLPAMAVWFALGCERLGEAMKLSERKQAVLCALVLAFLAVQAGRIRWMHYQENPKETLHFQVGTWLRQKQMGHGKVWAFGAEPSIYVYANWPQWYPYFGPEHTEYQALYGRHAGSPSEFMKELRSGNFSYLAFDLRPQPAGEGVPLPADLDALVAKAEDFGLRLIEESPNHLNKLYQISR